MTTAFPATLIELLRCAYAALGPYRADAVLTGGLVPFVYSHHAQYDAHAPLRPIGTKDADMAVPLPLIEREGKTLARRLQEGGLIPEVGRGIDGNDSITRFFLPSQRTGSDPYLEFLVQDSGRRQELAGRPQSDLRAHTVDFYELLVARTWTIDVPDIGDIQVPHPMCYAAQKTRIYDRRGPKWTKDQGDVVLTVWALRLLWDDMAQVWQELAQRKPMSKWLADAKKTWLRLYASASAAGSVAVSQVYRDRATVSVAPQDIATVMHLFLGRLEA